MPAVTVAIPGLSDSLPRLAEAGLASLLAWVLLWALIPLLRQRLLDQPLLVWTQILPLSVLWAMSMPSW